MGYAVRVTRIALGDTSAVYEWESTSGRRGHIVLDTAAGEFRPSTVDGTPVGDMLMQLDEEEVREPNPETVHDFLTVCGAIAREWKRAGEPPATANRYFG